MLNFVAKSFFSVEAIVEERIEQAAHECWTSIPRSFIPSFIFISLYQQLMVTMLLICRMFSGHDAKAVAAVLLF